MKKYYLLLIVLLLTGMETLKAQFTDLHDFNPAASGYCTPTPAGNLLYGTSTWGGASSNYGFIFSMKTDGTGFTHIYDSLQIFTSSSSYGSLTLSNGVLYGVSGYDIYSINVNGTAYKKLATLNDKYGRSPNGSLVLSGNVLYGMTVQGGTVDTISSGYGTVFSMQTDGTGLKVLYNFPQLTSYPYGSLTLSGNVLFGMTSGLGGGGNGNIFSINTNGSGYTDLHDFNGTDGQNPGGSLTISGNVLYGMTSFGGTNADGNIFSINADGTGFKNLFSLPVGSASPSANSFGTLAIVGGILYGMSSTVVYSINTDGTGFNWYNWSLFGYNQRFDSGDPQNSSLVLDNGMLYGMTDKGGTGNLGVIFSFTPLGMSIHESSLSKIEIVVAPNPATDFILIQSTSNEDQALIAELFNLAGQIIKSQRMPTPASTIEMKMDVSDIHAGFYFLRVGNATQKVQILR
jgi:uncharacterized repeat protein (TIGR03803 family)